jgi:hypothetical protein
MADFAGAIMASHANFTSGGVGAMEPGILASPTGALPPILLHTQESPAADIQEIQKCPADYDQIPHGWRPSPFMGTCGYKIQAKKFYSADTPCYPIQDLSCMGPTQKRVWANICATEFPCKALDAVISVDNRPQHDEPLAFNRFLSDTWAVISTNGFLLLGVTLGSCLTMSLRKTSSPTRKDNDADDNDDDDDDDDDDD